MRSMVTGGGLAAALVLAVGAASAQHSGHHPNQPAAGHHGHHGGHAAPAADTRQSVAIPAPMAAHMLANMRDHLAALQEITDAMAKGRNDEAARIAEQRLGMTSLRAHGAHDIAQFMPQGMQDAGTAMHRSASRFAIEVQNAAVTGDPKPALAALSQVMTACVGCHAGYRVK